MNISSHVTTLYSTKQLPLTQAFTNIIQYAKDSKIWKEVMATIGEDMAPKAAVEYCEFKHLVKTLVKR